MKILFLHKNVVFIYFCTMMTLTMGNSGRIIMYQNGAKRGDEFFYPLYPFVCQVPDKAHQPCIDMFIDLVPELHRECSVSGRQDTRVLGTHGKDYIRIIAV